MTEFQEFILESEYREYISEIDAVISALESGETLNEGLIDQLTSKFTEGVEFIKEFAKLVGAKLLDFLKLFKNKFLFGFFSKIGWSISYLIDIVKKGYKLWQQLHKVISQYIADTKIMKFTKAELEKLDQYLESHPLVKKAGSLLVIGFLIYQWTNMISFTGDIDFDFDQTVLFDAIKGQYSLADLFGTPSGAKMLMFIATGVITGLSFPWPGSPGMLFAGSLIYTVAKQKFPTIAKSIKDNINKLK